VSDRSPSPAAPTRIRTPWRSYKERLAVLAQRVVDAQRPVKVLDAIKWSPEIFEQFRDSGWREMPKLTLDDYVRTDLGYDPDAAYAEFRDIESAVNREFGPDDGVARILAETAAEYARVVEMLKTRGTRRFYELSRELYGSPKDLLPDDVTALRDVALHMYDVLTQLDERALGDIEVADIPAEQVVQVLNERLAAVFGDGTVRVILDDGIVADAAAGSDYIKIRAAAMFSERDIRVLEVHEGWVHLATNLNGQNQPVVRWLAKGPPRAAATQEGLAALLEVLTYSSSSARARRINDRVLAVDKAEDGASFLDVFEWFRTEGYDEETCFWSTQRVFRGGLLDGGAPFTKDVVYTKGIVETYEFLRTAIAAGHPEQIRWLFVGKVALADVPVLAAHAHEGIVRPPRFVPELFQNLNGLGIWLGISTLFGRLKRRALTRHYEALLNPE
jgi:uncharacterized protein (TIGR02421 family)